MKILQVVMMNRKIFILVILLFNSYKTFAQSETTKEPSTYKDSIHTIVDLPAEFPGGNVVWHKYQQRNLNVELDSTEVSSTLIASFIVHKDGKLSDITIQNPKPSRSKIEAAYIKLLKSGPKWIPAFKNGRKVASKVSWSITIYISEE